MSNYTGISASAMRTISHQWLHDTTVHGLLSAEAKTAALLPDIAETHETLCVCLGGDDVAPIEAQIAALRGDGSTSDGLHDRKYRGSWMLLGALAELADKPEVSEKLLAVRDKIQPNGLRHVNAMWADEAGHAATVRSVLDEPTRTMLKGIGSVEGRTLDDEVQIWVNAAESLGPIAAKKAALEHELANPVKVTDSGALHLARLAWIRTARALESNLDLVKGLSAEKRGAILGLLHQAATTGERRLRRNEKGTQVDGAVDGEAVVGGVMARGDVSISRS